MALQPAKNWPDQGRPRGAGVFPLAMNSKSVLCSKILCVLQPGTLMMYFNLMFLHHIYPQL
jgi:hypothetical protein